MSYDNIPNRDTTTCPKCGGALWYEDKSFDYQTGFLVIETLCLDCGCTIDLTALKITSEAKTEAGKSLRCYWLMRMANRLESLMMAYDNEANYAKIESEQS